MTSDNDYLLKQWFESRPADQHINEDTRAMMVNMLESSIERLDTVEIDLATAKIIMEEVCDWHACNVIDEAHRTMNSAVALIREKLEEMKND